MTFRSFFKVIFGMALLHSNAATSQIIYHELCDVPCNICKPNDATKIEYRADPKRNLVVRLYGASDIYVIPKCTVIDKDNWTCEGTIWNYKEYGKQYAVNGVAFWEDGIPTQSEIEGKFRVCRYDKNILGQLKLRGRGAK